MLYRGSEITREVAWVIFDEIHYLRDKGRVMEHGIRRNNHRYVLFLWQSEVSSGKKRLFSSLTMSITCFSQPRFRMRSNLLNGSPFYIIKYVRSSLLPIQAVTLYWYFISLSLLALPCCLYRCSTGPTPSLHLSGRCRWSTFGSGWNGSSSLVRFGSARHLFFFQGKFREDNFSAAMATLRDVGDAAKGDKRGRRGGFKGNLASGFHLGLSSPSVAETNVFKIVKMIMERNLAPVIVFSFSKKDCESYACAIGKLNFNSGSYRSFIVFHPTMAVSSRWRKTTRRRSIQQRHRSSIRRRQEITPDQHRLTPLEERCWHSSFRLTADHQGNHWNSLRWRFN